MIRALGAAAAAVALCAAGCAPKTEAQYKTLSFFFDGVPKPPAAAQEGAPAEGPPPAAGAAPKKTRTLYEHGPYAAKECDACHVPQTNALRAPREELCLTCHDIRITKKKVHDPFSGGDCRACHDPHSSPNPFMLVAPPAKLCTSCHDRGSSSDHAGADNCIDCHDAHQSDDESLVK